MHQTALRTDGATRVRWLCNCGAGTGVSGGKDSEPTPVDRQWGILSASERVAGQEHMLKMNR